MTYTPRMKITGTLALLLAALLMAGCSALFGRPDPERRWDHDATPVPDRVPWAVAVFQASGGMSLAVGNGTVVHSCDVHGTYVLTALHCVDEGPAAGIWIYDWESALPEDGLVSDKDELRCYDVTRVFPAPPPEDGTEAGEVLAEFSTTMSKLRADFAILRVETSGSFPAAPIYAGDDEDLRDGSPVEIVAINPEQYPHKHLFTWSDVWPEDVFKQGHSGSPILHQGKVFAVVASAWKGTRSVAMGGRPSVAEMRRMLAKEGLAFVLTDGDCSASR
jgi:hypothetical protein